MHISERRFVECKTGFGDNIGFDVVAIDEVQNVINIWRTLKIMHDVFPKIQVIAVGSSSFDLANKTGEPLVGRSRTSVLYPFSINELQNADNVFNVFANLENFLRYGSEIWDVSLYLRHDRNQCA
jgi:predicted AAA+ superfamily ATPase